MLKIFNKTKLLVIIGLLFTSQAFSMELTVKTEGYQGEWRFNNVTYSGTSLYSIDNVDAGSYKLYIGSNSINILLGEDGTVTSSNTAAITGGQNEFTFNVTEVIIDPDQYTGQYYLPKVTRGRYGLSSVQLVTGLTYSMTIGTDNKRFAVAENGDTSVVDDHGAFYCTGNRITFNNTVINIYPGDYTYRYYFLSIDTGSQRGDHQVVLIPDTSSRLGIQRYVIVVDTDRSGNPSVQNSAAISVQGKSLYFNTAAVTIDPQAFEHTIWFGNESSSVGKTTVNLVKNHKYSINIAHGDKLVFDLDEDGNFKSLDKDVADIIGKTLTFRNVPVYATATNTDMRLQLSYQPPYTLTEEKEIILIPNITYKATALQSPFPTERQIFTLSAPCSLMPEVLSYSFGDLTLRCSAQISDSDNDGIADDQDNCPSTPNEFQLDLDNDGKGDACDTDTDGDQVLNEKDNCPLVLNVDQSDLDNDGLGDVCDTDTDNDGVVDTDDNCPYVPNADQGNSDNDSLGDKCDTDDDNDNILDEEDNCVLIPNTDQSDYDADGAGDLCDIDYDGDLVPNDLDTCPLTPVGTTVNSDGCNAKQYISQQCVVEQFKNHGQYVSCVAKAANKAVKDGLILEKEKHLYVKEAAKK